VAAIFLPVMWLKKSSIFSPKVPRKNLLKDVNYWLYAMKMDRIRIWSVAYL